MTPPPINIDGTDITGATIDGQDVEQITIDGQDVLSAIPDSVVDNFEDAPDGPYGSSDSLTTYYTITAGGFARTTTDSIAGNKSLEATGPSGSKFSDGIISQPGDGLPTYPAEGETVSLIVTEPPNFNPMVIGAVPAGGSLEGYAGVFSSSSDYRIFRLDGGSGTQLGSQVSAASPPVEIVIAPPATGESTVEASVWSLDADLSRDTQQGTISASDSTYAGERGVGIGYSSTSGTGTFADQLRVGRGL